VVSSTENKLPELVTKTVKMIEEKGLLETLEKFPQSLLIIRLSLGKSQREFIKLLHNSISQPILIKHEKGKTQRMTKKQANKISKILEKIPFELKIERVVENFKKFKNMQKGHLTSEKARKLQKIWVKKTTTEQRKLWGKLGTEKAKKGKLTFSERRVKKILEELKLPHKVHEQFIIDEKLSFNVDFLIDKGKKIVIEVTERLNNLTLAAQALSFRSLLIKQIHPEVVTICIIPAKITLMGKEVLNRSFDKVLSLSELNNLKDFLLQVTTPST
jgi:hypothetical protein